MNSSEIQPYLPPAFVDQAERELLGFVAAHSDSMPIAIDRDRVIRYCDQRLRMILGYGWMAEIVNGATLIDVLLPPELRAWHAEAIERWFTAPRILDMHSRGPLPIMAKFGAVYSALVKLVPYEPTEQGRRPLYDQPRYHHFAIAFVTILPRSWEPYGYTVPVQSEQPPNVHAGGASGRPPEPATGGRQAQPADNAARGIPPIPPGGSAPYPRMDEPNFERNWPDVRSSGRYSKP